MELLAIHSQCIAPEHFVIGCDIKTYMDKINDFEIVINNITDY